MAVARWLERRLASREEGGKLPLRLGHCDNEFISNFSWFNTIENAQFGNCVTHANYTAHVENVVRQSKADPITIYPWR